MLRPYAERATGFEPVTSSLGSWHSTPELRPPGLEQLRREAIYVPGSKDERRRPHDDRLYRHAAIPGRSAVTLNA